jgi:signal peptidase II
MWRLGLVIAAVVLFLDRISKWYLISVYDMPYRGEVDVLPPVFKLVMWWNRGISFGLFEAGTQVMRWVFVVLFSGICVVLVFWLMRASRRITFIGLGLVLGGAIGNISDRIIYGAVADFFYFHVGDWYFPAFNVADIGISLGAALLLLDAVTERQPGR